MLTQLRCSLRASSASLLRLRLCLVSQISPPSLMPGVVSGQDGGRGSDYAADASISAPLG